jgi:hypothetical protein
MARSSRRSTVEAAPAAAVTLRIAVALDGDAAGARVSQTMKSVRVLPEFSRDAAGTGLIQAWRGWWWW